MLSGGVFSFACDCGAYANTIGVMAAKKRLFSMRVPSEDAQG